MTDIKKPEEKTSIGAFMFNFVFWAILIAYLYTGFSYKIWNPVNTFKYYVGSYAPAKVVAAEASIIDGLVISVTNKDSLDWENTTLIINKKYIFLLSNAYPPGTVKAGKNTQLALKTFVDKDGNRFNPQTQKVMKLLINASSKGIPLESSLEW